MPLYEYKCKSCSKTFEVLQRINEEPLRQCLYCKGPIDKLISNTSFQFKGTGWYVSDYKRKNDTARTDTINNCDINNCPSTGKDKNATIK